MTVAVEPSSSKLDLLAERILIGPEPLRHRLIDNYNWRRVGLVLVSEDTAFDQRNADRLEVIRHGGIEHHFRLHALWRRLAIGQNDRCCVRRCR